MANEIQLTDEQSHAVETITDWMETDSPEFHLGGYAGTGKTTIIKTILKTLHDDYLMRCCAFTGKAVHVLQKKGVMASTMHSLMYDVDKDPKTGTIQFHKKSILEDDPDLIIVDEASMVSTDLYNDLRSFGTKRLFVGDPGQLEPVGDNPNLMAQPDIVLSKIHRQAELSPIITLANSVRIGGTLFPLRKVEGLEIRAKSSGMMASEATACDQIICAKNLTRLGMNGKIRIFMQKKGLLDTDEKIIVLRNNSQFGVFNGMILFVRYFEEGPGDCWVCQCEDEAGTKFADLPIWRRPFEDPELRKKKDLNMPIPKFKDTKAQMVLADYGYVITCHKSQGSEWDHILVFDEWMPPEVWDIKRWRYTAITRAAKQLTYLL